MKKRIFYFLLCIIICFVFVACKQTPPIDEENSFYSNDVLYEVNLRQYTEEGTIEAFREHLPRLQQLGVDILWFMPIHPISETNRKGTLGSYYSVSNYHEVNPEFGTLEEFKALVKEAHEYGFKVILDFVANHTGWDHPWIEEHPDWYTQDGSGNIIHPSGTDWTDVADLNYNNSSMRQAMIEEMKFWVSEVDIDGYRCDHVDGVPREFWVEVIQELNSIKPVFMLAEDNGSYGSNDPFNSHYSFSLMEIINGIARGTRTPKEIVSLFNNYKKSYQSGTFPMIYTTNHDMNSWTGSINTLLQDATKVMNVITFTLPGMPLIYSGQEVNDPQQLLFFEKDEINWGDWEANSYHTFYQQLTSLKHINKALTNDALNNLTITHENNQILKYSRITEDSTVLVFLNMTSNQQKATFIFEVGTYTDYFSQKKVTYEENDSITIPAWGYYVFIK